MGAHRAGLGESIISAIGSAPPIPPLNLFSFDRQHLLRDFTLPDHLLSPLSNFIRPTGYFLSLRPSKITFAPPLPNLSKNVLGR